MEDLARKVEAIDLSLHNSKTSLLGLKRDANRDITSKIVEIRDALHQSKHQLQDVNYQVKALLEDVDDRIEQKSFNIELQVIRMRTMVDSVSNSLREAESRASLAIHESMSFQSSIADIEQQIIVKRRELDNATREGDGLKSKAVRDKKASLKLIKETEEDITAKDRSILAKSGEAYTLRTELSTQRSQLSSLNTDLENAQQLARRKKGKAWSSGLLAVGGLFLAPVTGGASLVLTAGAAGYGTVKAIEYDEIKDQIRGLRSSISTTEGKITAADSKVDELGTEKKSLESRLQRLKNTLKSEEATRSRSQKEIDHADRLAMDIDSLQRQAQAASTEARTSVRELGALKSKLHEVVTKVSEEATQLTVETSDVTRHRRGLESKRLQRRNRAAIASVAEALSNAELNLPAMLTTPSMQSLTESTKGADKDVIITIERMPSFIPS